VKGQASRKIEGSRHCVVGYPPSHACDVYRMLNMKTKHVIKLRDMKWFHKTDEDRCVKEDQNNEKLDDI
jgi:hypothetical protein